MQCYQTTPQHAMQLHLYLQVPTATTHIMLTTRLVKNNFQSIAHFQPSHFEWHHVVSAISMPGYQF